MSTRRVTNLLGLAVLSYLTQQPMHAYEIQRQLKNNDAATTFKLSYGALYSVVRQLLDAGFIAPAGTGQRGNLPRHTVYELTESGRAETRDWLRELLAEPRHEYPAFAAALSLVVVLPPTEVTELLRERLTRIEAHSSAIRTTADETVAGGVHPIFLVEDEYRCALLDAEAAFIRGLLARIADPAAGWAAFWQAHQQDPATQTDGSEDIGSTP